MLIDTIKRKKNQDSGTRWYVMCHMSPSWIENMLEKDSSGQLRREGETPLPPYRYYIPYQHMPHVITNAKANQKAYDDRHYDPVKDEESLRGDLHRFVFIQAPVERVEAIVKSDWNTGSRLRLYYYRDTDRSEVTIPDADMHRLIQTLQERHLKFYLDQPIDDFSVGDKVILQMEPWTGKQAEIKKITIKHDQVKVTVGLNILGRMKSITFPDIAVGDVKFVDRERGRLLTGNPITNYEEEILDLLSHRFCQKFSEEVAELDKQRLKRLAAYANIYVEDDDEQARFTALKLICAYLRGDKGRKELYTDKVMELLGGKVEELFTLHPSLYTFRVAYLMMALFITTRDPRYRDAVKAYRHTHPDSPDILRRYHAIVKGLKSKKVKRH